jgi:hypothetical protein
MQPIASLRSYGCRAAKPPDTANLTAAARARSCLVPKSLEAINVRHRFAAQGPGADRDAGPEEPAPRFHMTLPTGADGGTGSGVKLAGDLHSDLLARRLWRRYIARWTLRRSRRSFASCPPVRFGPGGQIVVRQTRTERRRWLMANDVLRLPWRRSRGCCQRIREVARGDLDFDVGDGAR